jgi:hypothetical protein
LGQQPAWPQVPSLVAVQAQPQEKLSSTKNNYAPNPNNY